MTGFSDSLMGAFEHTCGGRGYLLILGKESTTVQYHNRIPKLDKYHSISMNQSEKYIGNSLLVGPVNRLLDL